MKKINKLIALTLVLLSLPFALFAAGCTQYDAVLNVYNWGEFASLGESDDLPDIRKEFESWYFENYGQRIKVNYDVYDSNEVCRSKLESGAVNIDVIIPSDYMIEYFIENDMLEKLNYDNIPNFKTNIDDKFKNLFYDPKNEYTVPYSYGIVGVIYDANVVDEADAKDWDLLWNPKYKSKILNFDNSRDGFGTAMYKLGIDVNTTKKEDWDRAYNELIKQRDECDVAYVMDLIFDKMESGNAAVGAYYAGDYFTMLDAQAEDVDLKFYYPERTNLYVDAMCIPKGAKNKELAEIFINFMLSKEIAVANAKTTYYATPNKLVYEDAEYREYLEDAYDVLYPEDIDFTAMYSANAYHNLDETTLKYMNELWLRVKNR